MMWHVKKTLRTIIALKTTIIRDGNNTIMHLRIISFILLLLRWRLRPKSSHCQYFRWTLNIMSLRHHCCTGGRHQTRRSKKHYSRRRRLSLEMFTLRLGRVYNILLCCAVYYHSSYCPALEYFKRNTRLVEQWSCWSNKIWAKYNINTPELRRKNREIIL